MHSIAQPNPTRYRWDRVRYYKLVEYGILDEAPGVELIDGQIFRLPNPTPRRSAVMTYLLNFLIPQLNHRATVRTRAAIVFNDFTEPEPDIAIIENNPKRYAKAHPTVAYTHLLMAISGSTAAHDLTQRVFLYATAGIPEYWVVDLNRDMVIVHRNPIGNRYDDVRECGPDETIAPQAFGEIELKVRDILLLD